MTLSAEYAALSRRYADRGDLRLAQLAAWAGDVHALESLLWENGLDQAPDPAAELAAVGDSVAASVEDAARHLPADEPLTVRAVVEAAREAMVTTFDESVHGLLADRLADLDALDTAFAGESADRAARTASRLDGRTPDALVAELQMAAGDCATMAALLATVDDSDAGPRLARQAERAAFEAHLVHAAVAGGDDALVTVDLRWDLAGALDGGFPVGAVARPYHGRERLAAALGSAEYDALRRSFESLLDPVTGVS